MKQVCVGVLATIVSLIGSTTSAAQAAANQPGTGAQTNGSSAVGSQMVSQASISPDTRTEKQKMLAQQMERLFDMATELKVQVDKTNKNILSLKVVEKAEEIEALAKGMRGQVKK